MNSRERVLAVLAGEPIDRFPVDLWYTGEVYEALAKHLGVDDESALWRALGLDKVAWVVIPYKENDESAGRTPWGVELETMEAGAATYMENRRPPLANASSVKEIEDYPYWPDPDRFDYQAGAEQASTYAEEFATLGPWVSFFEIYCQLRGIENALMDVAVAPELVEAALERIEFCQTEQIKRFIDAANGSIDMIFVSDDMGSQNGLLFGLDAWDRLLRPRMERWCRLIHDHGAKVFYHSDGAVNSLIPRLIECGIDVLNPIQHLCSGMDMAGLKVRYGNDLVFHGGVDNQQVLPFGTAADVRAEVRDCLHTLGGDGKGFIACSCHNIQAGTPVENVLALVETVREAALT